MTVIVILCHVFLTRSHPMFSFPNSCVPNFQAKKTYMLRFVRPVIHFEATSNSSTCLGIYRIEGSVWYGLVPHINCFTLRYFKIISPANELYNRIQHQNRSKPCKTASTMGHFSLLHPSCQKKPTKHLPWIRRVSSRIVAHQVGAFALHRQEERSGGSVRVPMIHIGTT